MTEPAPHDPADRDDLDPTQTVAAALGLPIPDADPDELDARQFTNKALGLPAGESWADQLATTDGIVSAALGRPHTTHEPERRTEAAQDTVDAALGLD